MSVFIFLNHTVAGECYYFMTTIAVAAAVAVAVAVAD